MRRRPAPWRHAVAARPAHQASRPPWLGVLEPWPREQAPRPCPPRSRRGPPYSLQRQRRSNRCRSPKRVSGPGDRAGVVRNHRPMCPCRPRGPRCRPPWCAGARAVGSRREAALFARYPTVAEQPRAPWAQAVPVGCRRSSALAAPPSRLRRRQTGRPTRICAHCSAPRARRSRVRARPVQTPGGRPSDPTSGRSLLKVAPAVGAGGIPRAAPLGVASPVRSDRSPRLKARTRSLSSRPRGPAKDGETARSVAARRTLQVTTATATETAVAAEFGCVKALDVVILSSSLVLHRVRPGPATRPLGLGRGAARARQGRPRCPCGQDQGAFAGGRRSGAPIGWAVR